MKKAVKKKMTIDDLAIVMAGSFSGLEERLTKEIVGVKKDVESVKNQLEGTNKRIDDFAETKVSKTTHKELQKRVIFLEEKLEINK
jgi:hypothetical protein